MGLEGLFELVEGHPAYLRLLDGVRQGNAGQVHRMEALEAARPYLLAALWSRLGLPVLVIVPRPEDARRLHDQLNSYLGEEAPVLLFPEPEVLPFERLVADAATNNQRLLALTALLQFRDGVPVEDMGVDQRPRPADAPLVVASTTAALRRTLSPEVLGRARHTLRVGERVRLGELFSRWLDLGYQREEGVEVPGTFSQRGGIVDIYPPSYHLPARVEFLGVQVESIRLFDPVSQRSLRKVDRVDIIPAREVVPSLADEGRVSQLIGRMNFSRCTPAARERFQEELAGIFSGRDVEELSLYNGLLNHGALSDHLPEGGLLVLDREGEIEAEALELADRAEALRATREARGELPANFPSPGLSLEEFQSGVQGRTRLLLQGWTGAGEGFDFRPAPPYFGRLDQFAGDVGSMLADGGRVVVVSRHARRVSEVLEETDVSATLASDLDTPPSPGSLSVYAGNLREGWSLPAESGGLTLLADSELFGMAKERRPKRKTPVRRESFLSELVPGGFVVHVDHGVARFAGTTHMEPLPSGQPSPREESPPFNPPLPRGESPLSNPPLARGDMGGREYLVLEYAEGDKLYVPTDHLDRVSPYLASNEVAPSLTRLGTAEWSRVKERVKKSTREMASELLELYAGRQVAVGHACSPDSPWQREMEDPFPYEETPDQQRTIMEVKRDMEEPRPMDRLVCGDVGYGKTEVALRAAFKTVNDSMQVGLLVPTTVLAQQHYSTFTERLGPFPVRVEVLSRFRTRKEQMEVIEGLRLGTVDVVIGTHRLLQRDVKFKSLGLVVVDEEQRFGVAHKEQLKRMRREVDMLTLSATPIPRTLYMGLSGIRDMSTMETPPEERLPVKTYLSEYSEDVIKEAILRELDRGGQVFFLHNRVQTIRRVADNLQRLVPQARIAVGHGRMAEAGLEEVMVSFAQGGIDVLVCTTIIESGLDIPNANTLIIDRADRFGLSQLYQLRGRVGRGSHRAFSYLLIPRGRRITEAAGKRLKAILEAGELGAGFRIAMRDLEIRGAGNILGAQQSGYIHAVGFELYAQLLNEAVAEAKVSQGDAPPDAEAKAKSDTRVSLSLPAHILEDYISHLPTRLAIYQRLTRVRSRQEVEDIREELRDRFGPLPEPIDNLLYLVDLKLLAGDAGVESVNQSGATVTLTLADALGGAKPALQKALGPLATVGNQQVHVRMGTAGDPWKESLITILERLASFREQLGAYPAPLRTAP